jgi:hypothetical protein
MERLLLEVSRVLARTERREVSLGRDLLEVGEHGRRVALVQARELGAQTAT